MEGVLKGFRGYFLDRVVNILNMLPEEVVKSAAITETFRQAQKDAVVMNAFTQTHINLVGQ